MSQALSLVKVRTRTGRESSSEALKRRVCGTKPAVGVKVAHRHAERLRDLGDDVSAYRCVFCRWWHVGPAPSMETIHELALVIRGLAP